MYIYNTDHTYVEYRYEGASRHHGNILWTQKQPVAHENSKHGNDVGSPALWSVFQLVCLELIEACTGLPAAVRKINGQMHVRDQAAILLDT